MGKPKQDANPDTEEAKPRAKPSFADVPQSARAFMAAHRFQFLAAPGLDSLVRVVILRSARTVAVISSADGCS